MKKEITAHVEHNNGKLFSVYLPEKVLPFGVMGDGFSLEEAKHDFLVSLEEMSRIYTERTGEQVEEFSVRFVLDLSALLSHYKTFVPLAALARLTGINKAQLSQYACGVRNALPKTEARIRQALRKLGEDLVAVAS